MYQSGIDAVSERQKMTIKQYIRKVCQEKDEIGLESKFIFLWTLHQGQPAETSNTAAPLQPEILLLTHFTIIFSRLEGIL